MCLCAHVRMCGYKRAKQWRPCSSVCGSHDSLGCHIHLCLFAKFDFKYLSHHTSWLKQIAGKVLLSVKHVVRRMEALEGTSMFHLVKYMTMGSVCAATALFTTGGWYRSKTFFLQSKVEASVLRWNVFHHTLSEAVYCICTFTFKGHVYCLQSCKFVLFT